MRITKNHPNYHYLTVKYCIIMVVFVQFGWLHPYSRQGRSPVIYDLHALLIICTYFIRSGSILHLRSTAQNHTRWSHHLRRTESLWQTFPRMNVQPFNLKGGSGVIIQKPAPLMLSLMGGDSRKCAMSGRLNSSIIPSPK